MDDKLHIYLRVSSETQVSDGFGIENQKEVGLRVSEKLGFEPVIHNEGSKSSSTENIEDRPVLGDLMFQINNGDVKNLWVFNNDRLSRNENVWNIIRLTLRQNGCRLFVGEGTEYDLKNYMDDFIFGIMSEVSKYDNRLRTERMRRGRLQKVRNGGWKGGPPPFGYDIKDGHLVPNSYEKRWVKKIYEEYSDGKSVYQISKLLMKNGVLTRRGNVVWNDRSLRVLLENTVYEGFYFYTDKFLNETVRVQTPKLVPMTVVKKVRKRLKEGTPPPSHLKTETLLRDFLVCGHCGFKYGQRIDRRKYKNHYFCRGNTERLRSIDGVTKKICDGGGFRVRSLRIEETDELIWTSVLNVVENSHLFKEMFKTDRLDGTSSFGDVKRQTELLKRQIKRNDKTVKDIEDSITSNVVDGILDEVSTTSYKNIVRKFEEKKRDLLSENEELKNQIYDISTSQKWINWVDEFRNKIDDLRTEELSVVDRKKFLSGVIDKIKVVSKNSQTHNLEIIFKSPFVGDRFEWKEKGKPSKGYDLFDGQTSLIVEMETSLVTKKNISQPQ